MKISLIMIAIAGFAETHRLDFAAALRRAMDQSPDVMLSRFDEANAQQAVEVARDPFSTKLTMGSGLAYTYGFPMSIEGSAPSLFQVQASQSIFNRPKSYLLAKAKVEARAASLLTAQRRDEVLERTARLYLDADHAQRNHAFLAGQISNLEAVLAAVRSRVEEGRALAIEAQRAEVNLKKARQRLRLLEAEQRHTSRHLAFVLGYDGSDMVEPVGEVSLSVPQANDAEEAIRQALDNSRELKKLQADLEAKSLELQASRSARLPQVDLIAQYALFSRFNNLDQYFNRFQTSNAQLGASFKFPALAGSAAGAMASQASTEISRLRVRVSQTRNRIELETRRLFEDLQLHKDNRDLAKLDLDVAREQVAITLAQLEEGRASRRQLEEARFLEAEKWTAYWDSQYLFDRARVAVLSATGGMAQLLNP